MIRIEKEISSWGESMKGAYEPITNRNIIPPNSLLTMLLTALSTRLAGFASEASWETPEGTEGVGIDTDGTGGFGTDTDGTEIPPGRPILVTKKADGDGDNEVQSESRMNQSL